MNASLLAEGLAPFVDPVALGIVLGGTTLATVIRTPAGDLLRALSALRVLVRRPFDADPLIVQVEALSRIAGRHGVVTLDQSVIADRDVALAIADIVDGDEPERVAERLADRRMRRAERHRAAAEVWSGIAETAPAIGMIGTLIGLVGMFLAMEDPRSIGGAMAIALLTTLYGAALAALVAAPIAARLRRLARAEWSERGRLAPPLIRLATRERPRARATRIEERAA